MPHVITQACCNDATCVDVCPVDCIHPRPDEPGYADTQMLFIDPRSCIDCGACVEVCPVGAISPEDELAPEHAVYAELNALAFAGSPTPDPVSRVGPRSEVRVRERPLLHVVVVGSGPAACYAAEELLDRSDVRAEVTMVERLPTPFGLVRAGVAPDHHHTKDVVRLFKRTAARVDMHLGVEVGVDVTHEELLRHAHAVLYAVGAPGARALGIPGEDLPGSVTAADFVAWYNGAPHAAERIFPLDAERAVVVGNGNVALDVARVLVAGVDRLGRTDIADHALVALRDSAIREVVVLGRRGAAQAAFTTPELLGLLDLPGVDVGVTAVEPASSADPLTAFTLRVLRDQAARRARPGNRHVELRFLRSPVAVLGEREVRGLRVERTELVEQGGRVLARGTGETEDLDCGLVLSAVGYRGAAIPGLPFDDARGVLPHVRGRVLGDGGPLPGVYCAGWIKRGPSGVIGTNRLCARESVESLVADRLAGVLDDPVPTGADLAALIAGRRPTALRYDGWKAIDRWERRLGIEAGRPRVKIVDLDQLYTVAAGTAPAS